MIPLPHGLAETAAPTDPDPETPTTRHDGWTAERQRIFVETVAEGQTVQVACADASFGGVAAGRDDAATGSLSIAVGANDMASRRKPT